MEFKVDDLGTFLKNKRKEMKLTIRYVACRCNISSGYISRIENNSSTPSLETIVNLSKVLQFEIEDVVDDSIDIGKTFDIVDILSNYNITLGDKEISKFEITKIIDIIKTIYSLSWEDETEKYYGISRILGNIKDIKERESKNNE